MLTGIRSAWHGWLQFADAGKLPAVLLALLLWMILGRKTRGAQTRLVYYGAGAAFLCVFPVTAMILMKYQTAFYDYPFLWNLVPMTILIAFGGTLFLTEHWKKEDGGLGYRSLFYNAFLTIACAAVLALCGGLGNGAVYANTAVRENAADREEVLQVLAEAEELAVQRRSVQNTGSGWQKKSAQDGADGQKAETDVQSSGQQQTEICIWAPAELLTWARTQRSGVTLLYGRNMWDPALNAYSYDVYPEELKRLYRWMEGIEEPVDSAAEEASEGEADAYTESGVRERVGQAFALGADCVLLPKELPGDDAQWIEALRVTGTEAEGAAAHTAGLEAEWAVWDEYADWTDLGEYYLLVKAD